MKINKSTVRLVLLVILIFILVFYYNPKKISRSLNACIYSHSRNEIITEDINIELNMRRKLLNKNLIEGTITINNKTYKVKTFPYGDLIRGIKSKFNEESYLLICIERANGRSINPINIKISKDFNYIYGNIRDEQLSKGRQMMIAASANNIKEADAVADKINSKNLRS